MKMKKPSDFKIWIMTWDGKHGIDSWPVVSEREPDLDSIKTSLKWHAGFVDGDDHLNCSGPWTIEDAMGHNITEETI
jgi:hypothetical protein